MKNKLKKYRELVLFIQQNGKKINETYVIDFDHRTYEYNKRGVTIIEENSQEVVTIFRDVIIRGMKNQKPIAVSLYYLARLLEDLKKNIDSFLQKYDNY